VQDISDWVVVMAEGRIIAEGTPEDISKNEVVIDAYLGSHHDSDLSDEHNQPVDIAVAAEAAAQRSARMNKEHDGE